MTIFARQLSFDHAQEITVCSFEMTLMIQMRNTLLLLLAPMLAGSVFVAPHFAFSKVVVKNSSSIQTDSHISIQNSGSSIVVKNGSVVSQERGEVSVDIVENMIVNGESLEPISLKFKSNKTDTPQIVKRVKDQYRDVQIQVTTGEVQDQTDKIQSKGSTNQGSGKSNNEMENNGKQKKSLLSILLSPFVWLFRIF